MKDLVLKKQDGILVIKINRPKAMNALNIQLIQAIGSAVKDLEADDDLHGAILTAEGDKAFAAGADIAEFADFDGNQGSDMAQKGHDIFNSIENCNKPVIACVNGFALGGGCELAMSCHIRLASENAKFGQPEVNLGLTPGYGGTQRLAQLIGKGRALQLLITGDMIEAETACSYGLVNAVYPSNELMAAAEKMLAKIGKKAPIAVAKCIELANAALNEEKNGFMMEIEEFGNCMNTQDFIEGTAAFLEKRKANFKGE